jgi:hypothetical protein
VNRTFDFYEYVIIMAVLWLFPESRALLSKEGVTLGEFGLFVIIAYASGQLVQALGNYLEWAWWKPTGGMPAGRMLSGDLLTAEQHRRLRGPIFFFTAKDTEIVRCLSQGNRAIATFVSRGHDLFATIHGRITLDNESKTIPTAPENRKCARVRGGADRTRTSKQAIMQGDGEALPQCARPSI